MAFNNGDFEVKQRARPTRPDVKNPGCDQIITERPTEDDDCPQHLCPNKATHWIPYGSFICTECLEQLKSEDIEEANEAEELKD